MLRAINGIQESAIIESLLPQNNRIQILKSNNSSEGKGGKSGSFFFQTEDKKFFVKTMSDEELQVLVELLPGMYNYFQQHN